MRKFLVFASVSLLSSGVPQAQDKLDPAQILGRAVSQARMCPATTMVTALDNSGKPRGPEKEVDTKTAVTNKLSLPIWFKKDRYVLSNVGNAGRINDREAYIIDFSPRPEAEQLEAEPGESKIFNKAINKLSGWVIIDIETGNIIALGTLLLKEVPYTKLRVPLGKLSKLEVELVQSPIGSEWLPSKFKLTIKYWAPTTFFREMHEQYVPRFQCPTLE